MSIIYCPATIETAEQAEALPRGTVAVRFDEEGFVWTANRRCRCGDMECGAWFSTDDDQLDDHEHMVGATAFIPTEITEGPGGHGRSWYILDPAYD